MRTILMALFALLPLSASAQEAGETVGTLSIPPGFASADDLPVNPAAPDGAMTVCRQGCRYETIRGALLAVPVGGKVWVDGGPGPNPLTYRGFAVNRPNVTVCGYGAVRPLIVSDKIAGDGQTHDGDRKGVVLLGTKASGVRLCDLNLRGAPKQASGDAAGLIYSVVGYHQPVPKTPHPVTIERVGFRDSHGGFFQGQSYRPVAVHIVDSWFRNLASNYLNHAIYMSNTSGSLTVERSRFYKAYKGGSNTGSHVRSRAPVTRIIGNVFGEPGDNASRPLHLAPSARDVEFVGNLVYKDGAAGNDFVIEFENRKESKGHKAMKRFVVRDNVVEMRSAGHAMIRANWPLEKLIAAPDFADNRLLQVPAPRGRPVENAYDWHHYYAPGKQRHDYMPMPGIMAAD